MINYGNMFLTITSYMPAVNTIKGLFFYTFIAYLLFLLILRLSYKTDKELEEQIDNETKSFNKKLEELRKIKDKEAKELLNKINHLD
jgi:hypothetical protein